MTFSLWKSWFQFRGGLTAFRIYLINRLIKLSPKPRFHLLRDSSKSFIFNMVWMGLDVPLKNP